MNDSDDLDKLRWQRVFSDERARRTLLDKRHTICRAVREWFDKHGFLEVDAPLLVCGTTPDVAIDSFAVGERYLVTSTEYQIKRMIAGGFAQIYTLTQNFRLGDLSKLNNPEFTMLEWARVGVDLDEIEADAEQFVAAAAQALGLGEVIVYQGRRIDLRRPWQRMRVTDAISSVAGIAITDFSLTSLQDAVRSCGINFSRFSFDEPEFLFSALMSHAQCELGFDKPVFLRDWPLFQTSSAPRGASAGFAQRSELIIGGIEIADGFPFLTDHTRQAEAFAKQLQRREAAESEAISVDERYLAALRHGLPDGAGMALGFDRLVMVLTDQTQIRSLLAFAWDEL